MKKNISLFSLILTTVLFSCDPPRGQLENDFVKINSTLNNNLETIHLGDTLKFKLTLPDNLVTSTRTVAVNSLQEGWYLFDFALLDTVLKRGVKLNTNNNAVVITDGYLSANAAAVYLSNGNKPYTATINLIPPTKGIYTLSIVPQPGALRINNSNVPIGLKVNFDVTDKHWNMIAYYYNTYFNTDTNTFLGQLQDLNNEGYGYYGFRVN